MALHHAGEDRVEKTLHQTPGKFDKPEQPLKHTLTSLKVCKSSYNLSRLLLPWASLALQAQHGSQVRI
jgi:hypothetical protein